MPIKIYWGAPGSYKTASAIWDDVTECAKQGRVLITNVRGLTEARASTHLIDIKPGFRVMHFDTSKPNQMDALRRWHWWAPFGAFFVLDEVQALYPPGWTSKEFRELDLPPKGNVAQRNWPSGEAMPTGIEVCWDMHRHGNWDFTFTTPNIKKVRPEIRQAAEWAYKHRNLAYMGFWKGSYMEFQHEATDNGNASDIYFQRRRKVPPYVFQLYDSSATGKTSDSKAGVSIFKSPFFLLVASAIACLVAVLVYVGPPSVFKKKPAPAAAPAPVAGTGGVAAHPQGVQQRPVSVDGSTLGTAAPAPDLPNASMVWRLLGVIRKGDGTGVALLANAGARRRIDLKACKVADGYDEWHCMVDGAVVTRFTGPDVVGNMIGASKPLSF